jgi:hypothetical protein
MSRDPADFQFIGWYIDDGNMPFSEDSFGDAEKEQDIRECIGRGDLTMGTDPDTDDYVEQARQAGIPPFVRGTNGAWVRMNEVENAPNGRAEAISVSYLELAEIEPLATQLTEQELACPPVLR